MLSINKITSLTPIDFAAEELKKYLRMMMPECGDIGISYAPDAKEGFRLGLMQDFGLDVSDALDPELDDIIYIDCNTEGGIIAGDNAHSVLIAVYEYLRQNGCRWLLPGVDGEFIPMQDIKPVKYRHKPSCRCRSFCFEGGIIQQSILDMIDLSPKVGMNTYMLEHKETVWHYQHYYKHLNNEKNRKPEPLSEKDCKQFRRVCEVEIAKRGLIYHSVGHGFTFDPFKGDPEYPSYMAMIGGKRALYGGAPVYTNVCMSNPVVRKKIIDHAVSYASVNTHIDYLHLWLADMSNNHCECDACREKTPSDWYVVLLNELDAALSSAGLETRIVFISYVDTMWAPVCEKLANPNRFTLLFAPITRSYTDTLPPLPEGFSEAPYERNKLTLPKTLTENLSYLKGWDKVYSGMRIAFEYHFWRHNFYDPTGIILARRIVEDVRAYKKNNIDGMIEDGTVRPFFPNGYAFYTMARSMYDTSLTEEDIARDYFPYLYGADWEKFYSLLLTLGDQFDQKFIEGEKSEAPEFSKYYNPRVAKKLSEIPKTLDLLRALVKENYNSDYRVRTVAVRLLEDFLDYALTLSRALCEKALGNEERALELFEKHINDFGAREVRIGRYYDQFMAGNAFKPIFKVGNTDKKPIIADTDV